MLVVDNTGSSSKNVSAVLESLLTPNSQTWLAGNQFVRLSKTLLGLTYAYLTTQQVGS